MKGPVDERLEWWVGAHVSSLPYCYGSTCSKYTRWKWKLYVAGLGERVGCCRPIIASRWIPVCCVRWMFGCDLDWWDRRGLR